MQTVTITTTPAEASGSFTVEIARDGAMDSVRTVEAATIKHATSSVLQESLDGGWIWTFTSSSTEALDVLEMEVVAPGEPRPDSRSRGTRR